MMTLYAKNMTGEMIPITLPLIYQDPARRSIDLVLKELARMVSPENPSRIRLVSYSDPYDSEVGKEQKYDLEKLMEELSDLSVEEQAEEQLEEQEHTRLEDVWKDGGILDYFLEDRPLSIRMHSWDSPVYGMTDHTRRRPFYSMEFWIYPTDDASNVLYTYSFAVCFRTGKLLRMSDYEILEDDGDCFISLSELPTWSDDIYTMLQSDPSIPLHYRQLLLRASYRKWLRILKNKSKLTLRERQLQVIHPTRHVYREREFFKKMYEEYRQAGSPFSPLISSDS